MHDLYVEIIKHNFLVTLEYGSTTSVNFNSA